MNDGGARVRIGLVAAAAALCLGMGGAAASEPPSLERGEALWAKCHSCHTYQRGGRNLVGPRLYGVFGRKAGSVSDYHYSEAMKKSGIVWNDATLDGYLAATQDFMPGNKMYGGLAIEQDRIDLLYWLKKVTAPPGR
ncbi:MAG TPA: cytochrome c family protein [Alphaproteobacteria bacterium]|jgi:cytochrome c|nr:cytochrome c family protein [Alphaproteobacteria bacterium]